MSQSSLEANSGEVKPVRVRSAVPLGPILKQFFAPGGRPFNHLHMGGTEFGFIAIHELGKSVTQRIAEIVDDPFEVPEFADSLKAAADRFKEETSI